MTTMNDAPVRKRDIEASAMWLSATADSSTSSVPAALREPSEAEEEVIHVDRIGASSRGLADRTRDQGARGPTTTKPGNGSRGITANQPRDDACRTQPKTSPDVSSRTRSHVTTPSDDRSTSTTVPGFSLIGRDLRIWMTASSMKPHDNSHHQTDRNVVVVDVPPALSSRRGIRRGGLRVLEQEPHLIGHMLVATVGSCVCPC